MRDSVRRWLAENGLDPDSDDVKKAAERIESDFQDRMNRTIAASRSVPVGPGERCAQDTRCCEGPVKRCVLHKDHLGPHRWGEP